MAAAAGDGCRRRQQRQLHRLDRDDPDASDHQGPAPGNRQRALEQTAAAHVAAVLRSPWTVKGPLAHAMPDKTLKHIFLCVLPRDPYEVLGIPAGASAPEIKAVYRQLARTFHPDVNADEEAIEHFREITEAFLILSDPARRKAYNRQRKRRSRRDLTEETETYLGLRVAGIDLGGVLGVSVTVRRRTLFPDLPEEDPAPLMALPPDSL